MNVTEARLLFQNELHPLYEKDESDEIIFLVFEAVIPKIIGTKADLIMKKEELISDVEHTRFEEILSELKMNKPVQYILGYSWFYGMKFIVNEDVLIPRPETEELVRKVISHFSFLKSQISILDIGTGSGCIAIALKKNLPNAIVSAMDISSKALDVAKRNAEMNEVKINFIQDDIFHLRTSDSVRRNFDIIVSNPPYVPLSDKPSLHQRVIAFEPHLALFADENDSLNFYKAISDVALQLLRPNGELYFEIHESAGCKVKELLSTKGFKNIDVIKDIQGKNRIIKATRL
jgi:release factor glutamine methyltransferase